MSQDLPQEPRDLMERLDRAIPPHTRRASGDSSDPLVNAAQRLAQAPDVALSDAALNRIEARLRAKTAEMPRVQPRRITAPRRWYVSRLLRYAAAACLALILALGGVAQASADSLPGDQLYPVKRAIEGVRLALVSDENEPSLRITLAERRLDEFERLLERRDVHTGTLQDATREMSRALDLLAAGHGDQTALGPRLARLTHTQHTLIERARPLASFAEFQTLNAAQQQNLSVQERIAGEGLAQDFRPDYTPTPTPTPTPTGTLTPTPPGEPASAPAGFGPPTRTPPGHGPTPGLGDNPPGQGGEHPGIGSEGQPPGQQKTQKPKDKKDK